MIKGTLLLLMCLSIAPAKSQHYNRSHISLVLGSGLNPRATTTQFDNSSEATLETKPAFRFHIGSTYTYNFNIRLGIKTGLIFGVRTINYQVNLDADQYGIPDNINEEFSSITNATIGFPLMLVYRIPINSKNVLAFDIGAELNLYRSGYFWSKFRIDTVNVQNLLIDLYIESAVKKPAVTIDVQLFPHWQLLLKNHRLFQIGLKTSLSVTKSPYEGQYVLLNNYPARSAGTYNIKNSWFGLELGYVFTRVPNPKRNKGKPKKNKSFNIN